jgi:8-oxo-dGTP pyrophosphatase MutT (NUDIX family)
MNDALLLDRIAARVGAHEPCPLPLGSRKAAAVALPILAGPAGGLSILFTVRAEDVEHHKGEISFPGGGVDAGDADTLATALREAEEEIGLDPRDVRVLGPLDDCVSISGYRVTPYVVSVDREDYPFRPARREVSKILKVPLDHLLDPMNHREEAGLDPAAPIHYFLWENHVIWGLTAAILHRFLELSFDFGAAEAPAAAPRRTPVVFEEFVARDRYAAALLRRFFGWMTAPAGGGLDPLTAGTFAHDADRYLRDFVVDLLEQPPERSGEAAVRSYLGNWYIIHTLEPSHVEIDRIAGALRLFHRWAAQSGILSEEAARKTEDVLRDPAFLHQRLDAFWELTPERIAAWRDVYDYRGLIAGKG